MKEGLTLLGKLEPTDLSLPTKSQEKKMFQMLEQRTSQVKSSKSTSRASTFRSIPDQWQDQRGVLEISLTQRVTVSVRASTDLANRNEYLVLRPNISLVSQTRQIFGLTGLNFVSRLRSNPLDCSHN